MLQNRDLAIYGLEMGKKPEVARALGLPEGGRHACLAIVDETTQPPRILEEMHFLPSRDGEQVLEMRTKQDIPREWDELRSHRYLADKGERLLSVWQRAVGIGIEIQYLKLPYSTADVPEAINCRAGVKGTTEAMGWDYVPINDPHDNCGNNTHIAELLTLDR